MRPAAGAPARFKTWDSAERKIPLSALVTSARAPDAEIVRFVAAVVVAALVAAPAGLAAERQTGLESAVIRQINQVRRSHGLKPLALSTKLSSAAAQHTREMGSDGYFEHSSYDKSPFWKRIERWYPSAGWSSWAVGENILWSSPDLTATSTVSNWMNSPGHRANLLARSWHEVGISAIHFDSAPGAYGDQPVTIVTADFGARHY